MTQKRHKKLSVDYISTTSSAALKYGSENWILKQRSRQRLEAAQMTFLRAIFRLTAIHKIRNTEIRARINVKNIVQEIEACRSFWVK